MQTEFKEEYLKFGLKVQYYRKLRGMTQEVFAERVGISWSFLARVESPTRVFGVSMGVLFKMAKVLNVPPSKLLED